METRLLGAAALLCLVEVLQAFAIEDKGDLFKRMVCPSFLMFENAAYLADMTFELPCNCKPEEVSSVVWYFQKDLGSPKTTVLTDFSGTVVVDSGHIDKGSSVLKRFSIRMFSLIIFRAQVMDSGHYLCGTKQGDFFYGYDVDVQPTTDIAVAFVDRGQHVQDDDTTKLFSLFTTFWDWTKCDRCGVRGEQRRIGLCYVQSAQLNPRYRTAVAPSITEPQHTQAVRNLERSSGLSFCGKGSPDEIILHPVQWHLEHLQPLGLHYAPGEAVPVNVLTVKNVSY
uniref:Family with sequence similarity 187 member A n=1 Tax=Athene cunicularia TaxID=194338 RepID=A0A663MW17_ATHCN